MKKSILSLAIATLALGFTACEDVPAPYTVNAGGDGSGSRFEKPYYIYVKKQDKEAAEQIVAQVRREQRGR